MDKWEYKFVRLYRDKSFGSKEQLLESQQAQMNDLGLQGWELVYVEDNWFYLKRKVTS